MTLTEHLTPVLKKLRLSGILDTLELRLNQAIDGNLDYAEFLFRILHDETERREGKQLSLRIRRAGFEHERTLESFDFAFNPQIPRAKIIDLSTCHFVERHENVFLIGPTGVGKSHIAQALGHRACRLGHNVLYVAAHDMLAQLRMGRADQTYDKKLLRFTGPDLLIIDDLGLRPLQHDEPLDLYEVFRQRYERGAMIITSNRALDEWGPLFKDELLASAAVDRLLHHSHVLIMEGETYRNPRSRRRHPDAANGSA